MKATARKQTDTDDELPEAGSKEQWIVAHYFCFMEVRLFGVFAKDGKPRTDWCPTHEINSMYRWHSYHAARKFLREHPELVGYVVLNLSEILKLSHNWHLAEYPELHKYCSECKP